MNDLVIVELGRKMKLLMDAVMLQQKQLDLLTLGLKHLDELVKLQTDALRILSGDKTI